MNHIIDVAGESIHLDEGRQSADLFLMLSCFAPDNVPRVTLSAQQLRELADACNHAADVIEEILLP